MILLLNVPRYFHTWHFCPFSCIKKEENHSIHAIFIRDIAWHLSIWFYYEIYEGIFIPWHFFCPFACKKERRALSSWKINLWYCLTSLNMVVLVTFVVQNNILSGQNVSLNVWKCMNRWKIVTTLFSTKVIKKSAYIGIQKWRKSPAPQDDDSMDMYWFMLTSSVLDRTGT